MNSNYEFTPPSSFYEVMIHVGYNPDLKALASKTFQRDITDEIFKQYKESYTQFLNSKFDLKKTVRVLNTNQSQLEQLVEEEHPEDPDSAKREAYRSIAFNLHQLAVRELFKERTKNPFIRFFIRLKNALTGYRFQLTSEYVESVANKFDLMAKKAPEEPVRAYFKSTAFLKRPLWTPIPENIMQKISELSSETLKTYIQDGSLPIKAFLDATERHYSFIIYKSFFSYFNPDQLVAIFEGIAERNNAIELLSFLKQEEMEKYFFAIKERLPHEQFGLRLLSYYNLSKEQLNLGQANRRGRSVIEDTSSLLTLDGQASILVLKQRIETNQTLPLLGYLREAAFKYYFPHAAPESLAEFLQREPHINGFNIVGHIKEIYRGTSKKVLLGDEILDRLNLYNAFK